MYIAEVKKILTDIPLRNLHFLKLFWPGSILSKRVNSISAVLHTPCSHQNFMVVNVWFTLLEQMITRINPGILFQYEVPESYLYLSM